MSSAAMPGELLVAHGQRDSQLAVGALLRSHAEVDQVVPVERSQQERHRHAEAGEHLVGLSLGVEVRHLVLAHERGHAIVAERHPLARVFERGPDHVLDAGVLRGLGHGGGFGQLLLGREVRPEERDAVRSIGALEGPLQALHVIDVGRDDLRAQLGQFFGLVGIGVSRDRARGEAAALVAQDGADQAAALRAGGAHNRNDLLFGHVDPPRQSLRMEV